MLRSCFGGVSSNELIAEGGKLYSERPEPFTFISVPVQDMGTLEVRPPKQGTRVAWHYCSATVREA